MVRGPQPRQWRRAIAPLIAAAACNGVVPLSRAAALYFDQNGNVAGGGVATGNAYTWDAASANWSTDPDGLAVTSSWDPTATAVFSAGAPGATFAAEIYGLGAVADSIDVEDGAVTIARVSLTLTGGQVNVNTGRSLTIGSVLAGAVRVAKTGAGTLTLTNSSNTFTGGLSVSGGGVLQFGGENILVGTLPSRTGASPAAPVADYVRLDAGTLRDSSVGNLNTFLNSRKGIFLHGGGGTIEVSDPNAANVHIYDGVISGNGGLTKAGPGLLRLGGASTYGGATTIAEGGIRLHAAGALPAGTALVIAAGGTLDLAGNDQTVGSLSGAGKIVTSAGRLTVNLSSATTWSGTFSGTGGLTVGGSSFLTLASAQTYTGATRIVGASPSPFGIRVGTGGVLPATAQLQLTSTGPDATPTFDLNGYNVSFGSVSVGGGGNPTITNDAAAPATLTVANTSSSTLAATLTGNLAFVKGGSSLLVLAAANTHTGATRVAGSVLAISDSAQLGDASSPANTLVLAGGTVRIDGVVTSPRAVIVEAAGGTVDTNGNAPTFAGAISGSGALIKSGAGTLTTGPLLLPSLTVNAEQVVVRAGAGTSRIGSLGVGSGRLDLTNNRAVFEFLSAGDVAGMLAAGRTVAGTWNGVSGIVSSWAAGDPKQASAIGYATAGALGVTSWDSASGLAGTEIVTRYTYYGDLNLDGVINGDDLARLDRSLARGVAVGSAVWTDGDVNYDRKVNSSDVLLTDRAYAIQNGPLSAEFLAVRESQFGSGYVSALVVSIPEPALGMAWAVLGLGRRRRSHANGGRRRW